MGTTTDTSAANWLTLQFPHPTNRITHLTADTGEIGF